jgi:mannose-6-phosphate isomerase-like protein (cupin superfamily)
MPSQSSRKRVLVGAEKDRDGEPFQFLDSTFQVKVSGKDTEGRCVIFDTIRPQKVGPLLHLHTDCDEWFMVRDGDWKFKVGDEIIRLKPGDSLLVPRLVPHAFVKTNDEPARLIIMHQPAVRMEEYFRLASRRPEIFQQGPEARKALAERYGMKILGPALTPD